METFAQKFNKLETSDVFVQSPFDKQLAMRSAFLQKYLPQEAAFINAAPNVKTQMFTTIMSKPPKFVGKDSMWQKPAELISQRKDPNFKQMIFDVAADIITVGAYGNRKKLTEALAKQGEEVRERDSLRLLYAQNVWNKFSLDSTLVKGLWKLGDPLFEALTGTKGGVTGGTFGADREKFMAYMDFQMNQDSRLRRMLQPMQSMATLGALAVDTGVLYKHLVGSAELPGIAANLMQSVGNLGKYKWMHALGSGIPRFIETWGVGAAHAAAGGFVGIVRENLHDIINEGQKDLTFQQMSQNSLRYFSDYALFDILAFGVGAGLKNLGIGAGRAIRGVHEKINPMEKLKGEIGRVAGGLPVDTAWYSRMPEGVQNSIKAIESARITFANVAEATADDLFKTNAAFQGFLAEGAGESWKVTSLVDAAKNAEFGSIKDSLKWMKKTSDVLNWTPQKTNVIASGQAGKNIVVSRMVKYNLPEASDDLIKTLPETIAPVGGKFTSEGVESFARGFLKTGGIDDVTLGTIKAVEKGTDIKLFRGDNELLTIPKAAINPKDEIKGITAIMDKLKTSVPEFGKGAEAGIVLESYGKTLKQRPLYTASWVQDTVESEGGKFLQQADGTFQVQFKGKVHNIAKPEDFGDTLVAGLIGDNKELVKTHLNYYENLKLIETDKGIAVGMPRKSKKAIVDGQEVYKLGVKRATDFYPDVPSLLKAHPEFTPKIPAQFGPKLTMVIDGLEPGIAMKRNVFAGTEDEILTELSKFKDLENKFTKPFKFGDATVQYDSMVYNVDLPHLGYRESFPTMGEVKEFLSHDLYTQLRKVGTAKGFVLDRFDGKYFISSGNGATRKIWTAQNLDEVANIFSQKALMPEWAPELTGMDAKVAASIKKLPGFQRKPLRSELRPETEHLTSWQVVQQFHRVPDAYFSKMASGGKFMEKLPTGGKDIAKFYRAIEDGLDVTMGFLKKDCDALDALFTLSSGKKMKSQYRMLVQELLEMPQNQWGEFVKTIPKLKPEMAEAIKSTAANTRKFLGEMKTKGLFAIMGIDPEKFLTEYYPRMRQYVSAYGKGYIPSDVAGLFKDIHGGNIPKDQLAFFKHARSSEIVTFAREKDPLVVLRKYLSTGYREQFIGPVIENFNKWAKVNAAKIDPALMRRFGTYLQDVAGLPASISESMMIEATQKLFKEIKIGDKVFARNLLDSITGLTYLGTLGWRPYPILRNSMQMFQMLAPRLGSNTWVFDAMKKVAKDSDGVIYKGLTEKGIIGSVLPVHGGEAFAGQEVIAKLTESGLKAYRNVDDYGRAVAYTAATDMFDDALARFTSKKITQAQFIDDAGLSRLAPERQADALDLIAAGKVDGAKDLFGRDIVMETMIPYRSGTNPLMFRGVIGRLFGQMGHYPAYFVENIRRGLGRGSFAHRLKFATTAVGNGLAITGALGVLGIKDESYLPWSQAMFTGGPWWDIMQQGLTSFEQSTSGAEARARLFGIVKDGDFFRFDPGKFWKSPLLTMMSLPPVIARNIIDAGTHLNQGDYYKFFMALSSAPGSLND